MRFFIKQYVDIKTEQLITDECTAYQNINRILPHIVIKCQDWYVDSGVHTNTIERFYALLKQGMFGQFHSVSQKHLQKCVDEFCCCYNHRNKNSALQETISRGLKL